MGGVMSIKDFFILVGECLLIFPVGFTLIHLAGWVLFRIMSMIGI